MSPIALGFTGFMQAENRVNGIRELEERLWTILPKSHVFRRKHTANAASMAKMIHDVWIKAPVTSPVFVFGHSMGGRKAASVCCKLKALGVPVRALGLSDAFGHKFGLLPIEVPANVIECWAFVSKDNVIQGSKIACESEATILHAPPPFDCSHPQMSRLPEFHDAIFNAVIAAAKGVEG